MAGLRKILRDLKLRLWAACYVLFCKEGGVMMLAYLFAQSVILGKKKYSQCPEALKPEIREILIDSGKEDLIDE